MRKLWGTGVCERCSEQTHWYDTITEGNGEMVVQPGILTKSVANYWKSPDVDKYLIEVICEKCGHHYRTKEYEEESV